MADYLGFPALVENAYDASQISSMDHPVEVAGIVTSVALHSGNLVGLFARPGIGLRRVHRAQRRAGGHFAEELLTDHHCEFGVGVHEI